MINFFKSIEARDSEEWGPATKVLIRMDHDDSGNPFVQVETIYLNHEDNHYWLIEKIRCASEEQAFDVIRSFDHISAVNFLDRQIEETGISFPE